MADYVKTAAHIMLSAIYLSTIRLFLTFLGMEAQDIRSVVKFERIAKFTPSRAK
jgi:hypothetical protein